MASATFGDVTVMYNDFNDSLVSTKFVGIDLNPGSSNADAQPMIFETLVMGGVLDGKKQIYPTWDEAILGHLRFSLGLTVRRWFGVSEFFLPMPSNIDYSKV
ncbi:MAG: hypothetical protein V7L11_25905, partial [Nostoc sp.]